MFEYGTWYKAALSSSSPGKKPISLVGISERTTTTLSNGVSFLSTSCRARYIEINVLPVPAQPNKNWFFPSFQVLNTSFWLELI